MKVHAAVVKEQGVTFAIIIVKRNVIQNTSLARGTAGKASSLFPRMPIILMAQDGRGTPTYSGRRDIVNFLSRVPVSAIPWKQYTSS